MNLFPFPNPCLTDNQLNDLTGITFDTAPMTSAVRFQGPREGWVVVAWLVAPLAALFAYTLLLIWRYHRANTRANPAWPWGLRRSKPEPIEW